VPSLSLPDPKGGVAAIEETESVKLFIDRAKALLPTFALNETNASAVAQICNRLDGIPLAIELAASRVKLLKVEQIASRLDDVFRLLTGGSRTALPRQQTLRAMIDWSYNLLSEPEKILFRRLAVFAGGWTMEAAEEICSIEGVDQYDILDLMARLVDKSLVVVTRQGTESRYRRLETIRQYARERLAESGEGESLRNRHMAYFCKLVERIEPGLRGPNQVSLMDGLEIELDNLRAALEWALDHDVSAGLQLAYKLHWLWHVRSYWSEGADWLEKFLHAESESLGSETRTETQIFHRAKALGVLIDKSFNLGDLQSVKACVEEGLALCEKLEGAIGIPPLASFIAVQAIIALLSGDVRQAKILAENSLALSQQSGNKFDVAEVEANVLIDLAARSGDWEAARLVNESNLATRRELGDKEGIAFGLYRGGILAVSQGDNELAHQLFESAVEASREAASDFLLGLSLGNLGAVYLLKGDMNQAHVYILQLARLAQEKWNPTHKATSICLLALYGFERKQFRKFLQLYGFLQGENPIIVYFYQFKFLETVLQKNMAIARAEIGEGIFKQAEAEGKAMTLDQALDYALEEFNV